MITVHKHIFISRTLKTKNLIKTKEIFVTVLISTFL